MATIVCDHPRPKLDLPGYIPRRMAWQVPANIPGLPPEAARVIQQALQGVYNELSRQGQQRNVIPLVEDLFVRPGSVVVGVGNGQTVTLLPPGASGYLDPVTLALSDVTSPVTVVAPDGSVTSLGEAGAYDFLPTSPEEYETSPAGSILSGGVPTDSLLGRDSAGTGAVEFITPTAPLEFDGAGHLRIAPTGISTGDIADDAVTNAKLTDMAANSVKANATAAIATPTDLVIPQQSVLGRSTADFPDLAAIVCGGGRRYLGSNSVNTTITFRALSQADMPTIQNNRFLGNITGAVTTPTSTDFFSLSSGPTGGIGWNATTSQFELFNILDNYFIGNVSGATATPVPVALPSLNSDTLTYDNTLKNFFRPALAGGDVTAPANSNVLTVAANAVSNNKLAQMAANTVKGNATGSTADPQDISVGTNSVLGRVAGNIVAATLVTAQITDANVTDAKISNRTALSVFGRSANSSGVGADIAAANDGEILRRSGTAIGFGTIATAGLADDSVTDAKLRNSGALSVIGRSANTSGDPADISASAASDAVLRESGSVLGFGTIATGGIANNAVTDAKLRQGGALSVIGRSANTTGNVADIAGSASSDAVLRINGTSLGFGTVATAGIAANAVTNAKLAQMATARLKGRTTSGTGDPEDLTLTNSTSVTWNAATGATISVERAALTGDVTASANSNATTIATAAVTLAKMADLADSTMIGRAKGAGTGVPQALTGFQTLAMMRITDSTDTTTTGVQTSYPTTANNYVRINTPSTLLDIQGMTAPVPSNSFFIIQIDRLKAGGAGSVVFRHENAGATGLRLNCPGNVDLFPKPGDVIFCVDHNNRWVLSCRTLTDGDKGDITVSSSGDTWTIDNDVISNAKLRNSGALSVIGRSANSSGDPADISATAASDAVFRESGSVLGFGTVATGGIANNAVTDAKLRQGAALSVIGRSANTTGNVADIATSADGDVLRRSGTTLGFGAIATAGITDAAVTLAKMANLAQSRIIGRAEGAGTGVPTALTPTEVVAIIDGENATWTGAHSFTGASHTVSPSGNVSITGTLISSTSTSTQVISSSGAEVILSASTTVDLNSPTRLQSSVAFNSILTSTDGSPIDDKAIGTVSIWRLTPNNTTTLLRGMVKSANSQIVYVVNVSTINTIQVQPEDTGSVAANRITLDGTSFSIGPLRACAFWYDATSTRWRPLDAY